MIAKKMEKIFKTTLEKKYEREMTSPAQFLSSKVLYNRNLRDLFEVTEDFAHEALHFKCTGKHLLPNVGFRSAVLHESEKITYGGILDKHFQYKPNSILITYIVFMSIIHFVNKVPAYDLLSLTNKNLKLPSGNFFITKIHQRAFVYKAMLAFIDELAADNRVFIREIEQLLNPLKYGRVQLVDELQYGVHYLLKEKSDQRNYLSYLKRTPFFDKFDCNTVASNDRPTIADDEHYLCSKRLPSLFLISCYHFTNPIYNTTATPMSILDGFWFSVKQEDQLVDKINSLESCDFAAWLSSGLYYVNNKDHEIAKQALYNLHRVVLPLRDRIDGYKMVMLESACKGSPYLQMSPNDILRGRKGLSLYLEGCEDNTE